MPIVEVAGLPWGATQSDLREIRRGIKAIVLGTPEFRLSEEWQVTVLFPENRLKVRPGEEQITIHMEFFDRELRTRQVVQEMLQSIGEMVMEQYPKSFVEVLPRRIDEQEGCWSSNPA